MLPIAAVGQVPSCKDSSITTSNYSNLKFEIIKIDTVVTHCVSGEYNSRNFKRWDSTTIWANIILMDLPVKVDLASLKMKVKAIMKDRRINKAFVFRDAFSSGLFKLSSSYAAQLLKERDGYLGQFNDN